MLKIFTSYLILKNRHNYTKISMFLRIIVFVHKNYDNTLKPSITEIVYEKNKQRAVLMLHAWFNYFTSQFLF